MHTSITEQMVICCPLLVTTDAAAITGHPLKTVVTVMHINSPKFNTSYVERNYLTLPTCRFKDSDVLLCVFPVQDLKPFVSRGLRSNLQLTAYLSTQIV